MLQHHTASCLHHGMVNLHQPHILLGARDDHELVLDFKCTKFDEHVKHLPM